MTTVPAVTVGALIGSRPEAIGLPLELLAGSAGLARRITSPYIQKTGLALAGFHEYLQPGRILLYGDSELRFLETLSPVARRYALHKSFEQNVPCLLVTGQSAIPPDLVVEAEQAGLPLLSTPVPTAAAIGKITALLEDRLAVREIIHGVLLDVLGLGVLLMGESGIGKSECALDLVVPRPPAGGGRHRRGPPPRRVHRHRQLPGADAQPHGAARARPDQRAGPVRRRRDAHLEAVELVVQLERWDESREYDRLGLDDQYFDLLGLRVPLVHMPVAPGRNLATLVEVAARNQLLRARGINAARALAARLEASLALPAAAGDADPEDEDGDVGDLT